MPTRIQNPQSLKPGDIYEDSFCHPCLCMKLEGSIVSGISLIDGTYPRSDDLQYTELRRLSLEEAWRWRTDGPTDKELDPAARWWEQKQPYQINPATLLENLYFFSLYQVEWHEALRNMLGSPIRHEWHDVHSNILDEGHDGTANITFRIYGTSGTAVVRVKASKNETEWLIDDLFVDIDPDKDRIILIRNGSAYK